MIEIIKNPPLEEILPLRFAWLRHDLKNPQACEYPVDKLPGNFHFAARDSQTQKLVAMGTFHQEKFELFPDIKSYRLRSLATDPQYMRQGIARRLLKTGESEVLNHGASLLWFNARIKAVPFYKSMGYIEASEEFEIIPIGPHVVMYKRLN